METILLNDENYKGVLERLDSEDRLAIDIETTGLNPRTDKVFAIAFYNMQVCAVVDFRGFGDSFLELEDFLYFFKKDKLWIGHNIKFDISFLEHAGVRFGGSLYCTKAHARLEHNDHLKYSLNDCAERAELGGKVAEAKDWLVENGHYHYVNIPGKKKRDKVIYFDRLPQKLLVEYAARDAGLAYNLYVYQQQKLTQMSKISNHNFSRLLEDEKKVTRTIIDMEAYGIKVNRDYCAKAFSYESNRAKEYSEKLTEVAGVEFVDSEKFLRPLFERFKIPYGTTEKGRPSFTDDVLANVDSPIANYVREYRDASKRAGTFFASFLHYSTPDSRIHTNFKQDGTATGRFSCAEPNIQQLSNEEESQPEFPVRRAFVPDPDCILVSCDYSQMEYRLFLDYAGEMKVIEEVKKGMDVHDACAKMMHVSRKQAKCLSEGGLVLTDRGFIPIESVLISDKVWDGFEFVTHSGVIFKGEKEIISYQGVKGTKDHLVLTREGFIELQIAKETHAEIICGFGFSGYFRGIKESFKSLFKGKIQISRLQMWDMLKNLFTSLPKYSERKKFRLQMPKESEMGENCSRAYSIFIRQILRCSLSMFKSFKQKLLKLWRQGHKSIVQIKRRMGRIFYFKIYKRRNNDLRDRSYRQQRSLLPREYSFSFLYRKLNEHSKKLYVQLQGRKNAHPKSSPKFSFGIPSMRSYLSNIYFKNIKNYANRDCSKSYKKTRVFDIQNCGPRNQFTYNGRIVHNCINFSLLFGAGVEKLGESLGVPFEEASRLRQLYFSSLPNVSKFMKTVQVKAKATKYIFNWKGRVYQFPDRNYVYKAVNYLIQGGCSDIMKTAMLKVDNLLKNSKQSRLLLTIHDELVCQIHKDELYLVPEIKHLMVEAYRPRFLPMDASLSYSADSLHDLKDWNNEQEARDEILRKSEERSNAFA